MNPLAVTPAAPLAAPVQGSCAPRFEPLRELFAGNLASGVDLGASLAVTVDGEFAVDLHGGWADAARSRPWAADTITLVFSTTKMMAALAALVLIDRGELELDAPVARYWPEFAAQGKSGVLVRHVLSHTSGVPGWEQRVTMEDLCDWDKSTALLAAQAPWWEPGTASGYQIRNHGHLIGELVRRVTGSRLGGFFDREIAAPLKADFHMGLSQADYGRLASHLLPSEPPSVDLASLPPASIPAKAILNPLEDPAFRTTDTYRQADLGAMNGYGNARSVSRALGALANGGQFDGIRVLSPRTIDRIFETQSQGIDRVLGIPLTWGVGFALPSPPFDSFAPAGSRVCFWGGYGGSMTIIDTDRRMTISFVMNKLAQGIIGGPRVARLVSCAYACSMAA